MKINVKRIAKKDKYTIGRVYIDDQYVCDSIEDKDRGLTDDMSVDQIKKIKIKDQTAIPSGTYTLTMNVYSPSFGKKDYYKKYCNGKLPRILNVKGFEGIRIHSGTTSKNSSGCVLVGENKEVGKVLNSRATYNKLFAKLKAASDKGEKITITIK